MYMIIQQGGSSRERYVSCHAPPVARGVRADDGKSIMKPIFGVLKGAKDGSFWEHFGVVLPEFARPGDLFWYPKTCCVVAELEESDFPLSTRIRWILRQES